MIYCHLNWTPEDRQQLAASFPADSLIFSQDCANETAQRDAFGQSEVALGNCPAAWLAEAPRLRFLQLESVGVSPYLGLNWAELRRRLVVANIGGLMAPAIAQTALAGILALNRRIHDSLAMQQSATWDAWKLRREALTLAGPRVLFLGFGASARVLASYLAPFEPVLVRYTRSSEAELRIPAALESELERCDIVVVAVPESPGTVGLLSRARLARLKSAAIVVNIGRGTTVDEDALVEILLQRRIFGAVIDVTHEEPLPPSHPLWKCPNTILTQHSAGGSRDENRRRSLFFAQNVARFRCGETPECLVAWERGY